MWAKILTFKRSKDLNCFSLCALNLFNAQVLQFELNYWNKSTFPQQSNLLRYTCRYILLCFYYVAAETYCGGSEFKYPGYVVNIPYTKPNPKPSLNKCKTAKLQKMYFLMQPCHLNFLICRLQLLCRTVITRDFLKFLASKVRLRTLWATKHTYCLWKPIDMKLDMCDANVQKHQFSNLPAF